MADSLQMLCVLLYKYNLYINSHIDYTINVYIYNRFYENLIHSLDTFIKKNIKISMVLLLNRNNMRKKNQVQNTISAFPNLITSTNKSSEERK